MSKVNIEFLKASGNYTKGDIAGFPKEQAEKYVEAKIAKVFKPEEKKTDPKK